MEDRTELQISIDNLIIAIAESLRINKLLDWLISKIEKYNKI